MSMPLIEFDNVSVHRHGHALFSGLNWTYREGETWAIVGPTGSGKSTFAQLLLGRQQISTGHIRWPLLDRVRAQGRQADYPSQVITHLSFREQSRLFSYVGHYYQQRFEFADSEEPLSLAQFLQTPHTGTSELKTIAEKLGISEQLTQPFLTLSNGQTRRARLARALLTHPALLVLDDPFVGVDAAGRAELTQWLATLVGAGHRIVLICREDVIPPWVTNVFRCGEPIPVEETSTVVRPPLMPGHSGVPETLVALNEVTIAHHGKRILDRVSWTVRAGERWAVVGPNGSGKTTLLSLLCGDHPQAYSNDVRLFGRKRGTGETIWDVKRNVGLLSPEFHLYFTEPLTAERTAATGFFDMLADRATSPEQIARIAELFAAFRITHLLQRPFRTLSTGEQRLVLLIRALIKRPRLLILDEPFQGFDCSLINRSRNWLDQELAPEQTLLFVTHDMQELPRCVDRLLRLDTGRVSASQAGVE